MFGELLIPMKGFLLGIVVMNELDLIISSFVIIS